jgi:hypothetical protein
LLRLGVRLDVWDKAHYVAAFKAAFVTYEKAPARVRSARRNGSCFFREPQRTQLESVELNEDRMKTEEWKGRAERPSWLKASVTALGQLIDLRRSSRPGASGSLNSHAT